MNPSSENEFSVLEHVVLDIQYVNSYCTLKDNDCQRPHMHAVCCIMTISTVNSEKFVTKVTSLTLVIRYY